jgi:hypothetical protein
MIMFGINCSKGGDGGDWEGANQQSWNMNKYACKTHFWQQYNNAIRQ